MSLILSQRSSSNLLVSKHYFLCQSVMKLHLKCLVYVSFKQGGKEKTQVFVEVVVLFF